MIDPTLMKTLVINTCGLSDTSFNLQIVPSFHPLLVLYCPHPFLCKPVLLHSRPCQSLIILLSVLPLFPLLSLRSGQQRHFELVCGLPFRDFSLLTGASSIWIPSLHTSRPSRLARRREQIFHAFFSRYIYNLV